MSWNLKIFVQTKPMKPKLEGKQRRREEEDIFLQPVPLISQIYRELSQIFKSKSHSPNDK